MKLFELKGPDSPQVNKISRISEVLKRDCAPFLNQIDFNIIEYQMHRGLVHKLKRKSTPSKLKLSNQLSSESELKDVHHQTKSFFENEMGGHFRAGLFATGDQEEASNYNYNDQGTNVIVFPIGNFKFCWSPIIKDLYNALECLVDESFRDHVLYEMSEDDRMEIARRWDIHPSEADWDMWEILSTLEVEFMLSEFGEYQTTDLKSAIKSNNEIMMLPPKAYFLQLSSSELQTIQQHLTKSFDK